MCVCVRVPVCVRAFVEAVKLLAVLDALQGLRLAQRNVLLEVRLDGRVLLVEVVQVLHGGARECARTCVRERQGARGEEETGERGRKERADLILTKQRRSADADPRGTAVESKERAKEKPQTMLTPGLDSDNLHDMKGNGYTNPHPPTHTHTRTGTDTQKQHTHTERERQTQTQTHRHTPLTGTRSLTTYMWGKG